MNLLAIAKQDLSQEQRSLVQALAQSLRPGQALWLSGYFAGLEDGGRQQLDPVQASSGTVSARSLTILYGSETGNSAEVAKSLAELAGGQGLQPLVANMIDYNPRNLKAEQDLLIVTSTHGDGDPPQTAVAFFEFVEGKKAPKLPDLRYAVLALGDSTYEHFCAAGKRLDERLAGLGATRMELRLDCDVDYETAVPNWMKGVLGKLTPLAKVAEGAVSSIAAQPPAKVHDKRNPFVATILENLALTGRGSSKETRHIELSLAESGLVYEPGDALGVLSRNDPALIDAILASLSLPSEASVLVKGEEKTLREAFETDFEISAVTPRFIDHWAQISKARELERLCGEARAEERANFLRHHHLIDILRRFPAKGIDAQNFIQGLRPLQPRLYSIASSQIAIPDEVHLTVSTVRYELHGEPRAGVTSGFFANRAEPETQVPVYVQSNPNFRLAKDDASILMIGAGTGIAPYRAFLQEREARGAKGKSWLFFGERNFRSDFLYQTEWQGFLKKGVLHRMNVAFSRDQSEKVYVQHRLRDQARDVYAWLQEGAHVYVCGDAANLAPGVQAALVGIVQQEGHVGRPAALDYLRALQRERRYQLDVY
jgi:sulfite reductase (NADPH) flavoprotein alpha-component